MATKKLIVNAFVFYSSDTKVSISNNNNFFTQTADVLYLSFSLTENIKKLDIGCIGEVHNFLTTLAR